MRVIRKRRRMEGKTDYKARLVMLSGKKDRIVFRRTNRYVIGQLIGSKEAQDFVKIGVDSRELVKYGWYESGSIKNLSACYLTGFLFGKKISDKFGKIQAIFDIGLYKNQRGGKMYAFLKGVVDAGIDVPHKKEIFPDEKRIHSKQDDWKKIKEKIENA